MTRLHWRRVVHDRLSPCLHRLAERIASDVLDRTGEGALDGARRAWLLKDSEEELSALVDDAENRGIGEQGAREMLATRALVRWLEGGDPPGTEAIGYLERAAEAIPCGPDEDERARRDAYLAAIAGLAGDEEAASGPWPDPEGRADPGRYRELLDFQGRSIRALMKERDLTIGELSGRSGIDTETLVPILFGLEEMRASAWIRLSKALGVPLDRFFEGLRYVPGGDPSGEWVYVIDRHPDEPGGSADPPGPHGPGDAR